MILLVLFFALCGIIYIYTCTGGQFMYICITGSKNNKDVYIKQSYRKESGKTSSRIYRKLGKFNDLLARFDGDKDKMMAWAKEEAAKDTAAYNKQKEKVSVQFSPAARIPLDEERSFNAGYLFLQKLCSELRIDNICRNIRNRHRFTYDLHAILTDLIYARILSPSSKMSSYSYCQSLLEPPGYSLQNVYRALSVMAQEADYIQEELYRDSNFVHDRNTKILYYDCTNYYFETEEESGDRKYGKSKEHRPNPIIQMDLFMDGDGFKRVSDDKSVDISKLPEDDKGLYYKDEPYTTKKLQQRLIITYSPKYALYQKSIRSKQIERAQAMLDSGNTKRTAGTQTIQPDLLEQQQLQKKVRLPISSIILMNIRSLKKASMMDFMQYARTC